MIDFRPIALVIGLLLIVLAATMLIPAAADSVSGHADWQVFLASAGVTVFVGVSLVLSSRSGGMTLSLRQAFMVATLVWVTLPVFAAFPFVFSELNLSYTDAFFEAMSGITTTGSTVISGLDKAPPGILLWRGILQLLGGLGIIVMAINVLPMLQIGGMQMFRAEAFEAEDKTLPRMAQVAGGITMIYIALTAIWAGALWLAGMTGLDAAVHAMTTIATGGYSNWDSSVGHFDSALIDAIITAGMIVGGIPFLLYLKGLHGNPRALLQDQQVRWYLALLFVAVVAVADWLIVVNDMSVLQAFRYASFNVVSIMTGTGYSSTDFTLWGTFPVGLLFFLMFVGGCAGSTTCGIKVFRFQILYEVTAAQVRQLIHPHGVFVPRYNTRPIERRIVTSVLSFFFLFGACFALLSVLLSLLGLDFVTAVSSAASALANVGPGLGDIVGPAGNFQSLPSAAKWMLAAGMLVGRLELFTVFVLLSPRFWRG